MKQTAVEWLIEQLSIDQFPNDIPKILEQAKEMEKQQIKSFQTKISDEEMNDVDWEKFTGHSAKFGFIEYAKWYEEQLKKKQ